MLIFLVVFGLGGVLSTTAQASSKAFYTLDEGVTFEVVDGAAVKLDLARPSAETGPSPVVIYLVGDGWGYAEMGRASDSIEIRLAARHGYIGVAADYRAARRQPDGTFKNTFPAQINDVKAAVRWLRANAAKYNIDPDHIGVAGYSSGGHLALLAGLTAPSDGLEGSGGNMEYSSRVQAVASSCGPTDLTYSYLHGLRDEVGALKGAPPDQALDAYKSASPVSHVTADAPPILQLHGKYDMMVEMAEAEQLDKELQAAGVPSSLVVKNGAHGDWRLDPVVWSFLDKYLRGQR